MMKERYEDALERIRLIPAEKTTPEPYRRFFSETAGFLLRLDHWYRRFAEEDILTTKDIAALREMSGLSNGLSVSLADGCPLDAIAASESEALQQQSPPLSNGLSVSLADGTPGMTTSNALDIILSALHREITALVPAVYEKRETRITAALELFIQVYCLFEDAEQTTSLEKSVRNILYSYFYDYSEEMQEEVLREFFDPRDSYLQRFLFETDFSSEDAMYRSGEYVSPAVRTRFATIQNLSEAEIDVQLREWRQTIGRIDGEGQHADSRKPYVLLLGTPGRERLYQRFARELRAEGIGITFPRAARGILMAVPEKRIGYYESPDPWRDWRHDYDLSLFMGDRLTARLLEERRHLLSVLSGEGNVCVAVIVDAQTSAPGRDAVELAKSAGAAENATKVSRDAETDVSRLHFTAHQDTVYKEYCRKAGELTLAQLFRNGMSEEAVDETLLF